MARNNDRDRGKKRSPARDTGRRTKAKVCVFCRDRVDWVDYKDVNLLRRFVSDRAKIKARRTTGTCMQHQRDLAIAIKTARELALIPYTQRTLSDKAGRGEGRGRGPRVAPTTGEVPGGAPAVVPDDVEVPTEGEGEPELAESAIA